MDNKNNNFTVPQGPKDILKATSMTFINGKNTTKFQVLKV